MEKRRYRILLLLLLFLLGFGLLFRSDPPAKLAYSDEEEKTFVIKKSKRKKEVISFPARRPASFGRVSFQDEMNKKAPPHYFSGGGSEVSEELFIPEVSEEPSSTVTVSENVSSNDPVYFGFTPQDQQPQVPFNMPERETNNNWGRTIGFSSVGLPPKAPAPLPAPISESSSSSSSGSGSSPRPLITSIHLDNGTLVIRGTDLDQITEMTVTGPSLSATLSSLTETSSEITARALSGVSLTIGTLYNLIISDAQGATTYPIEAELAPLTAAQDNFYLRWDATLMRWVETAPLWEKVATGVEHVDDVNNGEVKAEVINLDSTNSDKKIGMHAYGLNSVRPNTNTIESHNADWFQLAHNGSDRITINSGGQVGINNTTPSEVLDVKNQWGDSNIKSTGSLTASVILTTGTYLTQMFTDNTKGFIGTTSHNGSIPFGLRTNGQDRLYILRTGEVGIGTITPGVAFQVGESGDGTVARANAWNTFSDERLKKNFLLIDEPLRKIASINGYSYEWKEGNDSRRQIGLKAQEVQKVFPEVVSKGKDGILSVSYDKLVAPMIEAMKELQEENARLKKQNEDLEKRMARLEEQLPRK